MKPYSEVSIITNHRAQLVPSFVRPVLIGRFDELWDDYELLIQVMHGTQGI